MFQPVKVGTGQDSDGRLAFEGDCLVGVLVRLSALHGAEAGRWFLEAGFGALAGPPPAPFSDLEAAQAWMEGRLGPNA